MIYKTVIYCESGWYASQKLWRDASYAFRNRNNMSFVPYGTLAAKHNFGDWEYLSNDIKEVSERTGLSQDDLPNHDYEYVEIG